MWYTMGHMSRFWRYVPFLFLLLSLIWLPGVSYSQEGETASSKQDLIELNKKIESKRQEVKQIERSINEYKRRIAGTKVEAISLSNQIGLLDNHVAQVGLDVELVEQKGEALALEIESLNVSIEEKETVIEKQRDILSQLLRMLYIQEQRSYLEVALTHDNLSQFYDNLQYLKTIDRSLGGSIASMKKHSLQLKSEREQREDRQIRYAALAKELEQKKKDLVEQQFAKEDLLAQTRSSELTFKSLISSLKSQYQRIENDITGIEQEVRRKLREQDKFKNIEEDGDFILSWPTQSRYITARFRDPSYPYRHIFEHNAVDIRAAHGTPLKAAASGYVGRARHCDSASCYSYVMLVHSNGMSTVYGHMSRITVSQDQFVARGDVIGYSGGTPGTVGAGPFVTGPHLHFEVRKDGIPVNPIAYLMKDY